MQPEHSCSMSNTRPHPLDIPEAQNIQSGSATSFNTTTRHCVFVFTHRDNPYAPSIASSFYTSTSLLLYMYTPASLEK